MRKDASIRISKMTGYSTAQAAKIVGVSKNTLLRWMYTGILDEPQRSEVGGIVWRVWSKEDIERARHIKGTMRPGPKSKRKKT